MVRYLLIAVLWATPGLATTADCFLGFAAVADDPEALQRLIAKTYRDLLTTLGADRLSRAELEILLTESPFRVPQSATGHLALRRKLVEFEAMLDRKGWNTPTTVQRLRSELTAYQKAVEQQAVRRGRALRAELKDIEVVFPKTADPHFLPGGRWAIGLSSEALPSAPNELSYVVYDAENDKQVHLPRPKHFNNLIFNPEFGQSVYFGGAKPDQLTKVPFSNGELRWDQAEELMLTGNLGKPQTMKATNVPGEFLTDVSGTRIGFLTLAPGRSGHHSTILPAPDGNSQCTNFGWVPGKDQFFYTVKNKDGNFFHVVNRPSIHNMSMAETARPLPEKSGPIKWSFNGSYLIASGAGQGPNSSVHVAPSSPGGTFEAVKPLDGRPDFGVILELLPYPDRNAAVVIVRAIDGRAYAEYLDLEQKQGLKRVVLPSFFEPEVTLTGDASRLFYKSARNSLHSLNLDREFPY